MRQNARWAMISVLLLAAAAVLLWPQVAAFFASDACLDAGGSYDYLADRCDFQQNHPHIPFYGSWSFWLGAGACFIGFWIIGRKFATAA